MRKKTNVMTHQSARYHFKGQMLFNFIHYAEKKTILMTHRMHVTILKDKRYLNQLIMQKKNPILMTHQNACYHFKGQMPFKSTHYEKKKKPF